MFRRSLPCVIAARGRRDTWRGACLPVPDLFMTLDFDQGLAWIGSATSVPGKSLVAADLANIEALSVGPWDDTVRVVRHAT